MRELWTNTDGGSRSLTLEAETPAEAVLSAVELAIVRELLRSISTLESDALALVAPTHCWVREYTGYGAYLNFRRGPDAAHDDPPAARSQTRAAVTLNWCDSSHSPLHAIMFFDADCVSMVELVPMDDAGWGAAECRSLLEASLERVVITCHPSHE